MIASADIVGAIKRRTPPGLYPLARRVYHTFVAPVECWTIDLTDRVLKRTYNGRVLPPALLRFKVRGSASGEHFARIGRQCADDVATALARVGRPLHEFREVLDFGCGCGGTLVWLRDLAPQAALAGTDVDASAIAWCRGNLPFASFATNAPRPPLDYPAAQFDLVYAISVFTHLDADFERAWLGELQRVLRPNGIALVTLHGPQSWNEMPLADQQTLARDGFVFIENDASRGLFPDWYQTAFHSQTYVESTYAEFFDVIAYLPRTMNGHQDVVLLRRRAE
ncbi:MAG TPA: class I SAM-dependent methyltransferase [Pseudomonadales bacterium]|nr:class I SAM-dependent methyltransferase [Pseudomonadales bacterium]